MTSKIHLAVEQGQKPLSVVITAGQRGDSPQFEPVLEAIRVPRLGLGRPRKRPDRVWADKALPQQPLLPAQTRDQGHHPSACGPGPQPTQARLARRPAAHVRQGRLQAAARGRVRDQPPQAPPGRRHSVRQTRCPLRSGRAGRSHPNGCDQHRRNDPQTTSNSLPSGSCMAAA
ncbi:transposase [Nonomuraea muscovyensis]|uniref:transposase n=1 Tax=Nonomuraea muscovyensis TaxID=1124761 RepID=UPI003F4CF7F0